MNLLYSTALATLLTNIVTLVFSTTHRHAFGPSKWDKAHIDYREVVPVRVSNAGKSFPQRNQFLSYSNNVKDSRSLFYNLTAFGRTFSLRLVQDHSFVSPGLVVEHVFSANQSLPVDAGVRHCFYRGHVDGDSLSTAVMSVCMGLRGSFLTRGQGYFIEPKERERNLSTHSYTRIHVLHRLSDNRIARDGNATRGSCGLKDTFHPLNYTDSPTDNEEEQEEARGRRGKRYIEAGYVETMITADKSMVDAFPSKAELKTFLITVMGMVAEIYRHKSIGSSINIVLVKIIMLEYDLPEMEITSNAARSLRSFCRWQKDMNKPSDKDPEHFDTAILITRKDICRAAGKCDTLGLAELGTLCNPSRSCSIVEDTGLSSTFTIAHELAHVFNVPHDGDHNKCEKGSGDFNLMAPALSFNTKPWRWSSCSRRAIRQFFDLGYGKCLEDKPDTVQQTRYYTLMPGEKYDADEQCRLIFGSQSRLCPFMFEEPCKRLWCVKSIGNRQGCQTQHMPWADGTACGKSKWCVHGQCVKDQRLKVIEGGWGPWAIYGKCSRTCGGGIHFSERECNNPEPENGGKYCEGRRKKFKSCNEQACPAGSKDFRGIQCALNNDKPVKIKGLAKKVNWIPKYHNVRKDEQCKLYCRVENHPIYFKMSDKVIDGTQCNKYSSDVCVDGKCVAAGCDHVVGSNARYDICRICKGDNSLCKKYTNTYKKKPAYGYNFVYKIPIGSTNIHITQKGAIDDDNFLALKRTQGDGKYLINGGFVVGLGERDTVLDGARIWYSGSDKVKETINISGKTNEVLIVEVLSVGRLLPPKIRYSLNVPFIGPQKFEWGLAKRWGKCSEICQGRRRRRVRCFRVGDNAKVSSSRCRDKPRPSTPNEKCNTDCHLTWHIQRVGNCTARCGPGKQKQVVRCLRNRGDRRDIVPIKYCHGMKKPPSTTPCEGQCLDTRWVYTRWTQCSVTCGTGIQTRRANCVDMDGDFLPDSDCRASDRGVLQQVCEADCPRWITGAWGECSVTCGSGVQTRTLDCKRGSRIYPASTCNPAERLVTTRKCDRQACPRWDTEPWSRCSVSCGVGQRSRRVICRSTTDRSVIIPGGCNIRNRPPLTGRCVLGACPIEAHTRPSGGWRIAQWTRCSRSCDEGVRYRRVTCADRAGNELGYNYCDTNTRPATSERCTVRPCAARRAVSWKYGNWSPCSKSCGKGTRSRIVKCAFDNWQIAEDHQCEPDRRPPNEQECASQPCDDLAYSNRLAHSTSSVPTLPYRPTTPTRRYTPPTWAAGAWGACSVTCNKGVRRRVVTCRQGGRASSACVTSTRPSSTIVCSLAPCPHWISGKWSKCSLSCGVGVRVRTVRCSGPECNANTRPVESKSCNMGSCPTWTTRAWAQCSVTCGKGVQRRQVDCSTGKGDCNRVTRPSESRECQMVACPNWRTGEWGRCSASCDKGAQTRRVECDSSVHKCDARRKPVERRYCNYGRCPASWTEGQWSKCSVSCGEGIQLHTVICSSGVERECDKRAKPAETKRCILPACPEWVAGKWSKCSRTCGVGVTRRSVTCGSRDSPCNAVVKPRTIKQCNLQECPRWTTRPWSQCSVTCGRGVIRRTVECFPKNANCIRRNKPSETRPCTMERCPEWTAGQWSECSVSCGTGQLRRVVECSPKNGNCNQNTKPLVTRSCAREKCPVWITGGWSKCSVSCGKGYIMRTVECQPEGGRCTNNTRPSNVRECGLEACPAWKAGPWERCSSTCGNGYQARSVYCTASGVNKCDANKPASRRRCHPRPCPVWIPDQWSECSVSCGEGVQSRVVECSTDEWECNVKTKPSTTQRCERTECPVWTTGTWSECSSSCGEGYQKRSVDCTSKRGHRCDRRTKPEDTQRCNVGACPVWVPGSWSECSASCGEGVRRRTVECDSEDHECDRRKRPVETQICNLGGCPTWETGRWSICSVTCGDGVQSRDVECSTRDNKCHVKTKPRPSRKCNPRPCPVWKPGPWGKCSVSCGEGVVTRNVRCSSSDIQCHVNTKPSSTKPCQLKDCPTWTTGEWSECSVSCGGGVKRRTITCSPDSCDASTRPAGSQRCNDHKCSAWTVAAWGECSVTCGEGVRSRGVTCDMRNGQCNPDTKPAVTRQCILPDCPIWAAGLWGQCSVTCGKGIRIRDVVCYPDNVHCDEKLKPEETLQCELPECPAWTTGKWSECSARCGEGTRTRNASCSGGRDRCDEEIKPATAERCNLRPCMEWTAGQWSQCSVSCGVGRRERKVACSIQGRCHNRKPPSSALCNMGPCATWETGSWSQCSVSCGEGKKTRTVRCTDNNADACDVRTKPQTSSACGSDCPDWKIGKWSECSRTCGRGITSRQVQCVQGNTTVSFSSCGRNTRPVRRRVCQVLECVRGAKWQKGEWGECSSLCSAGTQTRKLWCAARNGTDIHEKYCSRRRMPVDERSCNTHRQCGVWETGAWSECSMSCGDGLKTRPIRCLYNIEYTKEENCYSASKPINQLPCRTRDCPQLSDIYHWSTTPWTKCSRTCGYGRKSRHVTCVDIEGHQVSKNLCSGQPTPPEYFPCFEVRCPPKWKVGDWSECSRTCGDGGYQVRPVTCEGVPGVDECNKRNKPPIWRPCHLGPCNGEFKWRVGSWSECSVACGSGQVKRSVRCFNFRNELMPDAYCRHPALKPDDARPCTMPPCTPRTCREIQLTSGLQADGEHVLMVQGKLLKIYCHGMTTDDPQEYITLKSGSKDNFAEVYTKRLINPRHCPASGKHIDNCQCSSDDYSNSGASYFTKLRIDVAKMRLIPDDLRFAATRGLKPPPYATAGDCYSSRRCPQGRFSINLEGTGLELSPDVRWRSTGKSFTQLIYRYPEGKQVIGKCGGRCGTCSPASGVGLQVVISKGHGRR